MALQFNPPDWVVQEYMNRRTPYQEASIGLQTGLQNYLAIDEAKRRKITLQRESDQRQATLGLEAAKMGYDPNNPGAYWEQFNADRQRKAQMDQSEITKNEAMAEAYKARGEGGGKPPTGFRWTTFGELEPIPGGPADIKTQQTNKEQQALHPGPHGRVRVIYNERKRLGAWRRFAPGQGRRDVFPDAGILCRDGLSVHERVALKFKGHVCLRCGCGSG